MLQILNPKNDFEFWDKLYEKIFKKINFQKKRDLKKTPSVYQESFLWQKP